MTSSNNTSHQGITAAGLTEADQNLNNSVEDKSHQAAGHKANLSNPSKFFTQRLRTLHFRSSKYGLNSGHLMAVMLGGMFRNVSTVLMAG